MKMSSIRMVLGLITSIDLEVKQIVIKITFLQGDLEEEIYMKQPQGLRTKEKRVMCAN